MWRCNLTEGYELPSTAHGEIGLDYSYNLSTSNLVIKLKRENRELKISNSEKGNRLITIQKELADVQRENEALKKQPEKQLIENGNSRQQGQKLEIEKLKRAIQEKEKRPPESKWAEADTTINMLQVQIGQLKKEKGKLENKLRLQQTSGVLKEDLHRVKICLQYDYKALNYKQPPSYISVDPRSCHNCGMYINEIYGLKAEVSRQKPSDIILDLRSCQNCWNYRNQISYLNAEVNNLQDRFKHKEELLETSERKVRELQEEINRLKSDNIIYQNDTEKLKIEATQLKNEIQLLDQKIRQKPSDIILDPRSCQNCRNYGNEISDLKATVTNLQDSLQKISKLKDEELLLHKKKMSSLQSENKDLIEKCKRTEELLNDSGMKTRQIQDEIIHLKSDNVCYQNDTEKLKNKETQLKKDIQLLEEKIRRNPTDILLDPRSCQNCGNNRNEISELKAELSRCKPTAELLQKSEKKTLQLQQEIIYLKSDNASCQNDREKLKNQTKELQREIQLLEEKIRKMESGILLDTRSCPNCRNYRNEISVLKSEVNNLRDRLSEAAGNKLRDNNPNIADLSDMNRPTLLAEKFSSLYTDEYTDAMEVIERAMDEQASALLMLQLLKSCYDLSKKLAEEQRHLLSVESFGFMKKYLEQPSDFQLSDSCLIYVKEFQKKISADGNNLRAVEMICLKDGLKQANLKSNQNIMKYMKKCSLLCWMMQISDPPIYLNFDVKVGDQLDKNVHNVFLKSGSQIEFLVWPAMYLCRTGPLLVKGVAQGK